MFQTQAFQASRAAFDRPICPECSAPMFIVMQIAGALVAVVLARFWHPTLKTADLVLPEPT